MIRSQIKVLVLTGDGINCEEETSLAFCELGVKTTIVHIHDLLMKKSMLNEHHILAIPGGFSFGDEIGSGQILALKLKYELGDELNKFIEQKKPIIGICNGFQALVRLGLVPKPFSPKEMTLTHNRQGHFINKWVDLTVPNSQCVWTKEMIGQNIQLPIRHGEGRIKFSGNEQEQQSHYQKLIEQKQIALYYDQDVNGSYKQIAGVCSPDGTIFGLMPHPEAAISFWHSPDGSQKSEEKGLGLLLFEGGINYVEKNLNF